jgi:hypothetical protein
LTQFSTAIRSNESAIYRRDFKGANPASSIPWYFAVV